jgi:hypothetical protein
MATSDRFTTGAGTGPAPAEGTPMLLRVTEWLLRCGPADAGAMGGAAVWALAAAVAAAVLRDWWCDR